MTWPTSSLSKTNVDADGDTVTGVGGGRDQLEDAIDRLNLLAAEAVALLDEAETFTAKKTFTLQDTPIELRGATTDGVYIPFHPDVSSPGTRKGRVGFVGDATNLDIENEHSGGHIIFTVAGAGEVRIGADRVLTEADSTTPADGTITRAKLDTATQQLAGSIGNGSTVQISMTHYCFFPMIHAIETAGGNMRLVPHATDQNDPDSPQFAFEHETAKSSNGGTYDVDYRYVDA